jgi:hypothetical protein
MKKAFAASLIGIVCLAVLGLHAWRTWSDVDHLPIDTSSDDRDLFQYSLFVESFVFMTSFAYFAGPPIYRFFKENDAAKRFEGEKRGVSKLVHTYSAILVIVRRLALDHQMGIPKTQTIFAITLICFPVGLELIRKKLAFKFSR